MRTLVRHPAPRALVIIGVAWGLLIAAVTMGLRFPLTEGVAGAGRSGGLDYSSHPRSLTPLSDTFIEAILGPQRGATVFQAAANPRPEKGSISAPATRRVVQHYLTNDEAQQAYGISTIPFTSRMSTMNSTRSDDPDTCGSVGGTVWYRYTAPRDVGLIASTFGTDHAVSIGVFRRVAGRWEVAAEPACKQDASGNALIWFPAMAGTTYYFQVTAQVTGGNLRFNLDPRGTITLASASDSGERGNDQFNTRQVNASPDGRFLSFQSYSDNLTPAGASSSCEFGPPSDENYSWVQDPGRVEVAGLVVYIDRSRCMQVYVRDRLAGKTTLVSASPDGIAGNGISASPFVSGDGRFVVFSSDASNLGPDEDIGFDLFFKDLRTGAVEVIARTGPQTQSSHWEQNVAWGWIPSVTDDGRYVAFQTPIALRPEDQNGIWDVYVFDRVTRTYELASVSSSEEPALPAPQRWYDMSHTEWAARHVDLTPFISPDGRYVVFRSPSHNLVESDTNGTWDTFVRDRFLGMTERVSVAPDGSQSLGPVMARYWFVTNPISADGRYVVFDAYANNTTPDALTRRNLVYVHDRVTGTTKRISIALSDDLPGAPHYPTISRNGRFVAYTNWGAGSRIEECRGDVVNDGKECFGDVLVYDMQTDTTLPITLGIDGQRAFGGAGGTVSDDGTIVSFLSYIGARDRQIWFYEAARPL